MHFPGLFSPRRTFYKFYFSSRVLVLATIKYKRNYHGKHIHRSTNMAAILYGSVSKRDMRVYLDSLLNTRFETKLPADQEDKHTRKELQY